MNKKQKSPESDRSTLTNASLSKIKEVSFVILLLIVSISVFIAFKNLINSNLFELLQIGFLLEIMDFIEILLIQAIIGTFLFIGFEILQILKKKIQIIKK